MIRDRYFRCLGLTSAALARFILTFIERWWDGAWRKRETS